MSSLKQNNWRFLALWILICSLLWNVFPPRSVHAEILPKNIVVNTSNDVINNDGLCSIVEAMQTAIALRPNTDCGPEVDGKVLITFAVATVNSTNQFPNPVNGSDVSLLGPVVINAGPTITFDVDGGTLNMAGLIIKGGTTVALNIHSEGSVNLAGVSFIDNTALVGGAAIVNQGKLRIAGGSFIANRITGGSGGAIESNGDLLIAGSAFTGNISANSGGAIYISGGKAEIDDTLFSANVANGDAGSGGGAIAIRPNGNLEPVKITRSVFVGNLSPRSGGGAILHDNNKADYPHLLIRSSSFTGNVAGVPILTPRPGGAILNWGSVAISNTLFLNNLATNNGGALANGDAESGTQASPPQRFGRFSISNSSFISNAAEGKGGAIANYYVSDGDTGRIYNSTFSGNSALEGGAFFNHEPNYDRLRIVNSIVDGNLPANCADPAPLNATLESLGHNLDSGASCGFTANGDIQNQSAQLDDPAFNGGPIASLVSQLPKLGSPAIDTGDLAVCNSPQVDKVDQRGQQRPKGEKCDIGALESDPPVAGFGSTPVQPGPIEFGNVTFNASQAKSIAIVNTGNKALQLSQPSITGANSADFALLSAFPLTVNDNGKIDLRCKPTGSNEGLRSAQFSFNTNDPDKPIVSYELSCNAVAEPAVGFGSQPVAPGPISFGTVLIGNSSEQKLRIQEQGTLQLKVNNATISGLHANNFAIIGNSDITINDGGAGVDLTVKCTPSAPNLRSATLSLKTNDLSKPEVSYQLTCEGKNPPPAAFDLNSITSSGAGGIIPLNVPYGLAMSPDGRQVYSVGYGNDTLHVFQRNPETGALDPSPVQSLTEPNNQLDGAIRVLASADGRNVYVASFNSDRVMNYKRDPQSGLLSLIDSVSNGTGYGCFPLPCNGKIEGMGGAYGMAISPDGQYFYVGGVKSSANNGSSITVLRRNQLTGALTSKLGNTFLGANFVQKVNHADLEGVYDLAISPDGMYLYAASYSNNPDSITVFKRNANGTLNYLSSIDSTAVSQLDGIFRLAISPDGEHLYAASYDSSAVVAFKRNPVSGGLSHIASYWDGGKDAVDQSIDGLAAASALAFSPDGSILYASGHDDHTVIAFERDPASGKLTVIQSVKRGANGQPPLTNPRDIVVGPEGASIHVSSFSDNKIVTLLRPNAKAILNMLQPASVTAGSANLTVVLTGENFHPQAKVRWNDALDLNTTFINSKQVSAVIPAAELTSAAFRSLKVVNPAPGGGSSNASGFTISAPNQNPVPSLGELLPGGAQAGDAGMVVTIKGSNFIQGSTVYWNGSARTTQFIDSTSLQVTLEASDLSQAGNQAVYISNPTPGGGNSNIVGFNVAAPGQNPVPSIEQISPAFITAGSHASQTISVKGNGFVEGVQALWNGEARPTTRISANELKVELSGADLTTAGTAALQVLNPAPGGGQSNSFNFVIGAVGDNPLPSLESISAIKNNGDGTLTISVKGSNFIQGSKLLWNGSERDTSFVNGSLLKVTITSKDFSPATSLLKVSNPSPGGGTSNSLLYSPYRVLLPLIKR